MCPRALIVEDDLTTQRLLARILSGDGIEVEVANDGDVAIDLVSRKQFDVILLDVVLPRVSGMSVMEHLRRTNPKMLECVVVVSGLDAAEIRSLFPTVRQTLTKPVLPTRLRESVRRCVSASARNASVA